MKKRRWSDNDKHFWPFTFSKGCHSQIGVILDSGRDERQGCHIRFCLFSFVLIMELPSIVRPFREKVAATGWDEATVARLGRDWYWNEDAREFGFSLSDGFLQLYYGRQSDSSDLEKRTSWFLPWTQWRQVRKTWYGTDGQHIKTFLEPTTLEGRRAQWDIEYEFEQTLEKVCFEFHDYDGELIVASTNMEEREHRLGTGHFKWVSFFVKPMIRTTLEIKFSKETGRRKGSWKGGTTGHGITMFFGELHEEAFRRYCAKHQMEFVGLVKSVKEKA